MAKVTRTTEAASQVNDVTCAAEQLYKRLAAVRWGLDERQRKRLLSRLMEDATSKDNTPTQRLGATMAIYEGEKIDQKNAEMMLKGFIAASLVKSGQDADSALEFTDEDLREGIAGLLTAPKQEPPRQDDQSQLLVDEVG